MTDALSFRSPELLSATTSLLLIVDVQERLIPQIHGKEAVLDRCARLIRGAGLFQVPVVITEQYPRGLGPTVAALTDLFTDNSGQRLLNGEPVPFTEKLRFSAAEATGWPAAGERQDGRFQVVLAGIETHICVLQTALDLLARGYRVFVAADAAGSRATLDHEIACHRLRDSGAALTTVESVLFEWCEVAGTDRFRQVRDLVKDA